MKPQQKQLPFDGKKHAEMIEKLDRIFGPMPKVERADVYFDYQAASKIAKASNDRNREDPMR